MKTGEQFLHDRNPKLHASSEVEAIVAYLRKNGENIPNQPAEKISAHLGFLANVANDGILTGDQTSLDRQIDFHVIDAEDVPDGYFELLRRIARDEGKGDIEITSELRETATEHIQQTQRESLKHWAHYFVGDGKELYPDWFKTYVWKSIMKLADFDKYKGEFRKRSNGTTAAFPDLNREGLAMVYSKLIASRFTGLKDDDPKWQQVLQGANFNKLYSLALKESASGIASAKELQNTNGSWKTYEQGDDPEIAKALALSLKGRGTGWCTSEEATAAAQLRNGEFFVFYSEDLNGEHNIPRVGIRTEFGHVEEVRGIVGSEDDLYAAGNTDQALEDSMLDATLEKLKELPGGDRHFQRVKELQSISTVYKKLEVDPHAVLSPQELMFLHCELTEYSGQTGYKIDPRAEELIELKKNRDWLNDMKIMFDTTSEVEIATQLLANNRAHLLVSKLELLGNLTQDDRLVIAKKMVADGDALYVVKHLEKFPGYDQRNLIARFVNVAEPKFALMHINKFTDLDQADILSIFIAAGRTQTVIENRKLFTNLDKAQIAKLFIAAGKEKDLVHNLLYFRGIQQKIARHLLQTGKGYLVAANLSEFHELTETQKSKIRKFFKISVRERAEG